MRAISLLAAGLVAGLVSSLSTGCDQTAFEPPGLGEDPPPGPGSPVWDDPDLTCSTDADCSPGETCDAEGHTCRPRQCEDGPYESGQPLGEARMLFREQELAIIDGTANAGAYWVDGYQASTSIEYSTANGNGSFQIGTAQLTDVARIQALTGGGIIASSAGSPRVTLTGRTIAKRDIDVGLVPVAVAAGDVDGDNKEEIIALAANGQIAICKQTGACQRYTFGGANLTGIDIAASDITGDGIDEIVFLLRSADDKTTAAVWSVGVQDGYKAVSFDVRFKAIAAGDIDHDGRAEVALLEDRGWFGWAADRVHVYRVGASFTGILAADTTGSSVDLAIGDIDGGDRGDALVVLGTNKAVDVLRWTGSTITKQFSGSVGTTRSPKRIALGDLDDDSASARLLSGPQLVPGRLVPTMVVQFPPFHSELSDAGESGVSVGSRTSISDSVTDTVSLAAGVEIGVDASFASVFKARLSTRMGIELSKSSTDAKSISVGTRFSLRPQTDLYGNQYAAVVVGCNCFHTYEYELVDPANRAGGTGKKFTVIVPVGGQTTVLSTARYNALATLQGLQKIETRARIGDVTSYARTPTKLDGTPVLADEHVFAARPTLRSSDVSTVGFSLSAGTSQTNTSAMTTSVSVSGSISALGVSVGADVGASFGKSYSITIGQSAEFGGEIPPLPDDPQTPEDEYATYGYAFQPFVYRQAYQDPISGEQTGYYVLDYTVGQP